MQKLIKIKLIHSPCGCKPDHRETVKGLGLRRLRAERVIVDTPASRGMVKKVKHLVTIVEENVKG